MRATLLAYLGRHGIPPWMLPDYFVLAALSGLLCSVLALRAARKDGARLDIAVRAIALAYIGALAGGYLFESLRALPLALAHHSFAPLQAGRAAWGGLIGSVLAASIYLRCRGEPIRPFLDRATLPSGIAFALVRTGCILAGCDYCTVTLLPWAVRFPAGSPAALDHARLGLISRGEPSLPVHPTQLYEAALGLLATGIVYATTGERQRTSHRFARWMAIYSVGRFGLEFLRGDRARGSALGLSTAQWTALFVLCAAAMLHRSVMDAARAP